jgi:hypothetical protein
MNKYKIIGWILAFILISGFTFGFVCLFNNVTGSWLLSLGVVLGAYAGVAILSGFIYLIVWLFDHD